jgi:hypothetical protein
LTITNKAWSLALELRVKLKPASKNESPPKKLSPSPSSYKLSEIAKKMDEANPSDLENKAKGDAGDSDIIEI